MLIVETIPLGSVYFELVFHGFGLHGLIMIKCKIETVNLAVQYLGVCPQPQSDMRVSTKVMIFEGVLNGRTLCKEGEIKIMYLFCSGHICLYRSSVAVIFASN